MHNEYLKNWTKMYLSSCAKYGKPRKEVVWMNYKQNLQMSIEDFPEVMP